jgi:hypothetical protein
VSNRPASRAQDDGHGNAASPSQGSPDASPGAPSVWSAVRLVPFIVVAGLVLIAVVDRGSFDRIAYFGGVSWGQLPFFDAFTPLSWYECAQKGVDITLANPCDTRSDLKFPISYPPAWMWFNFSGVDTSLTDAVGLVWAAMFLLALVLLPAPRTPVAAIAFLFAALSNAAMFGLYQANFDIVVLAGLIVAVRLVLLGGPWRYVAYGLILFLAVLKIYPAIAFVLALRYRLRHVLAVAGVTMSLLAIHVAVNLAAWLHAIAMIPGRDSIQMFGARNLAKGLANMWGPLIGAPASVAVIYTLLAGACLWGGYLLARQLHRSRLLARLSDAEAMVLLVAVCVMLFCFLSSQNFRYRAVFIIPAMAPLVTLWLGAEHRVTRAVLLAAILAAIASMWGVFALNFVDHVQKAIYAVDMPPSTVVRSIVWTGREVLWWFVMTVFAALLACLLPRLPAVEEVRTFAIRMLSLLRAPAGSRG